MLQIKNVLINKGLVHIDSGNLYGYEQFCQKFQVDLTFIGFYNLIHSIPISWKRIILNENIKLDSGSLLQKCMFNIINMRSVCWGVYWSFINSKEYKNKCIISCNKVLSMEIQSNLWQELFQ